MEVGTQVSCGFAVRNTHLQNHGGVDMKQKWLWFFNAVMLVIILVLVSCQRAPILSAVLPNNARAVCSVNGKPVILLNEQLLGTEESRFILTHEYVHIRQMGRNCLKMTEKYRTDSLYRVRSELEAYCEERRERMKYGQDGAFVMEGIKFVMSKYYSADTSNMSC